MQINRIVDFLKELVKFRQKEIVQMQHAKCKENVLVSYSSRTNDLIKLILEIESQGSAEQHQCNDEQLAALSKELEELKAKYKLAIEVCADYDNYKKRAQRTLTDTINKANKDIISDLLGIVDDFDRVKESIKEYESNPIIEGINLIYGNLMKLLDNEGCEKIKCKVDDKFDVNFHEAVATVPAVPLTNEPDTIQQVMQSGWMLNGSLLRPVKVVVRI